jgi:hypothetical protein
MNKTGMGILMVINLIITAGMFCGGVYFIFWCLRHFGII